MRSHCRYTAQTALFALCSTGPVTASRLPSQTPYFPFPPSFWTIIKWTKAFTLAVWRMVWHSRRVSLTALLQINGHLQRDVVSLRKSQRKATKLKKKGWRSWSLGESKSRVFSLGRRLSFRTRQVWQSSCKTITKPCCFIHLKDKKVTRGKGSTGFPTAVGKQQGQSC